MTFRLLIECSKDLDSLKINFSDGSSCVTTTQRDKSDVIRKPPEEFDNETSRRSRYKEEYLNLDTDFGGVSQEIVQKPDIVRIEKPISVAPELQKLDI